MKRFLAVMLFVICLFSSCKAENEAICIPDKGRYFVLEEISGTEFTVSHDGDYAEYVFTKPEAINSLTAVTENGAVYKLKFKGVEVCFSSFSVQTASDFCAALELLKTNGIVQAETIQADADRLYAIATHENGVIKTIEFFNGTHKRIYKIITEA